MELMLDVKPGNQNFRNELLMVLNAVMGCVQMTAADEPA
jgi:hypothetical protein